MFNDLKNKGYVVIKNFFSDAFIQLIINNYNNIKQINERPSGITGLNNNCVYKLNEIIKPLISEINKVISYGECVVSKGDCVFLNNLKTSYDFHQEHEPFFIYQDLSKYIIFYIPLIKKYEDRSGIAVIPFDKLKKSLPNDYAFILSKGARSYIMKNNKTIMISDSDNTIHIFHKNLNECVEIPKILPKDLLIMQGTIIHATQDQETNRLAATIRYIDKDTIINYDELFKYGSFQKQSMLNANYPRYESIKQIFNNKKKINLTVGELYADWHNSIKEYKEKYND